MKSFEVKALGLEELSLNEATLVEGGGFPWGRILRILRKAGKFAAESAAGYAVERCIGHEEDCEMTDEMEYYGGMLDAAVCWG